MNKMIYSEPTARSSLFSHPLFTGSPSCRDKFIHPVPRVGPAFLEKCDWCTNIEIVLFSRLRPLRSIKILDSAFEAEPLSYECSFEVQHLRPNPK